MIRRLYFLLTVLVALSVSGRGEWHSVKGNTSAYAAPQVTLVHDDANSTVLKIDVSGFEIRDLKAGDRLYKSVDLLTDVFTTEAGYPELPCVAKVLAVPDRAAISIEVVEVGEEQSFYGYAVPPARPSWKEGDPEPPYVELASAYASAETYPPQYASTDAPAVFRDFRIVRLAVYPVRYIASRNELRVATSLTIRIRYGQGTVVNPRTSLRKPIAPSYGPIYRSTIFNYQSVLDREYGGLEAGRDVLLCISPDNFVNSLMPFVNWRNKTGTQVKVTKFSQIGANATNPDIIKNYLAQVYHTWEYPPTYVLLVGDYGYVPTKSVTYDYTIISEDYFVEIDGNDFFPEMMIGRFTHETDAGEQIIVNKIIGYEKTPYTANRAWFTKGAVAANNSYQSAPATKRFARDRMMLDGHFSVVDTFLNHSPCYPAGLTDLINVINAGRSYLNYRGEGWYDGWWASCYPFKTNNVTSLNNGQMLTFVTSIGCGVGNFTASGGNCFGEEWLELGTVAAPRGAVTFIGPTSNTHTTYNNKIDMGIYMGMFQEGMDTPGQALMRGRLYMYSVFGNEHWVEYQTRVYCILGDPSLHVWKNAPDPVSVTHVSNIPVGYNQVLVAVADSATHTPIPNAHVCISGDSVFATGITDATGNVVIAVTPEMIDTATVLVRGAKIIPYEGSMGIAFEDQHIAPWGNPLVVDLDGNHDGRINPNEHAQITFTLKNWGTQSASGIQAVISADTNLVQIQTTGPVSYGHLAPGGSATGLPFQFFVKPGCAVGDTIEFRLHVTSTASSWDYTQKEDIKGCKLECVQFIVDDRGLPHSNARLDPGETVKLYMMVKNHGEDFAPGVMAHLRSANPHVTVIDSIGTFGTMPVDTTITNYSDFFIIHADSTCPTRTNMPLSLFFTTQGGLYPYAYIDTFSIPVGMPKRSDPTGPDSYGYYAYASDDTFFTQAPQYQWKEINGIGTELVRTSGDQTFTVTLPFTFKYYGVDYTQVRISTDGWIAFGSGTQTASANYPLPHNDAINCMVAAFWDNLFASSSEVGKLIYYNDALERRFVIEWYNVGHSSDATKKETFEIILYNPVWYQTPTGDGEIEMLYNNTADPGGNTVGIEDHTQTVGLQYTYNEYYDESATPLRDTLAIRFTTQPPQLLVSVDEQRRNGEGIPDGFALYQNYPNPFNPSTTFRYSIPVTARVSLKVYDMLGREVATLVDGIQPPGLKSVRFDAARLASGVYYYRLKAGDFTQTRKLILLR